MTKEEDLSGICEICNVKAIKENDKLRSELDILKAGIKKIDIMLKDEGYHVQINPNHDISLYISYNPCYSFAVDTATTLEELIIKIGEE